MKKNAYIIGSGGQAALVRRLVRPHLSAGDALLFDCRALHMGLANKTQPLIELSPSSLLSASNEYPRDEPEVRFHDDCSLSLDARPEAESSSTSIARPLLYVNYTREFFEDPKNWNNKERLFP